MKYFAPFSFAYISSIFGRDCHDRFPLLLLLMVIVSGCRAFILWKSTHIHLFIGFPFSDFFGTTTMGLAHRVKLF